MSKSKLLLLAAIAAALPVTAERAEAQSYPERAITLVVPFAPGGSTSIVARVIADKMSETLGQKVIVDNRPGAGGTIGTKAVVGSAPDGYTIVLGYTGTLAIGPSLYPNAGYDARKDLVAIGMIGHAPNSLVVHPSFPAKTLAELITYVKANPGKVNYGSAGVGTVSHVSGEYFANAAGIQLVHIPYKGTGPALTDLLGGHIPMAFAPVPATHSNVASGQTARARGHEHDPQRLDAGCADDRRGWYLGLRCFAVLRACRASAHAARHRRQASTRSCAQPSPPTT